MKRTILTIFCAAVLITACAFLFRQFYDPLSGNGVGRFDFFANAKVARLANTEVPEYVDIQLIGIDGEARRGRNLEDINAIVIHYVGNAGSSAQGNRDYFATAGTTVSSHFLIGLDGEVIQCIPLHEKSSATNDRNRDTISIECCHPTDDGEFNSATYDSLVKLVAWLCALNHFDRTNVIRHYDVTEKLCPLYYVEHEDAWEQFLDDVETELAAQSTNDDF